MWTYSQSSGVLADPTGKPCAAGYSGHGPGLNNPAMQDIHNIGPVPQGLYSLGAPLDHPTCGPFAIPLIPHDGNEMFGRSGFYVHGDDVRYPGQEVASDGCIVLDRPDREAVWNARFGPLDTTDHILKVTA